MINEQVRAFVRQRADNQCEYCQLPGEQSPFARLQLEHIRPKKHGGADDVENLALACIACNLHKGSNLTGIDPSTEEVVELFDPRVQPWYEHFRWNGPLIMGITAVGRTTVRVLEMNSRDRIRVRLAAE